MIDPRDHISEGITRDRLKLEGRRSLRPLLTLAAGALVALGIAAFLLTHISPTFGRSTMDVRFEVADDFGVFVGFDQVRFRGVPAGTIQRVERHGTQLVLVAKVDKRYSPIYRNARAQLRSITPLNDMYLDITDPGTAVAGAVGGGRPLPESQTSTSVFVPDVLDALGPDQQRGLHSLLDGLGRGMADGGLRLRRAFVSLAPFLQQAGALAQQVAERRQATRRLVHNTAVLTTELGRREADLKRLVGSGAAMLGTLQRGSRDLDATIAQVPPTFTELRAGLAAVRRVVDDVDRGLTSLYPVADRLPRGLRAIRALSASLGPAVRRLRSPVERLAPLARTLRPVSHDAAAVAAALLPQVPTVDRLTRRLVACERGVIGFFQWNTSLNKFGDANAPIPRGNLAFGVPDSGIPNVPRRAPVQACTPGQPARAVITSQDEH